MFTYIWYSESYSLLFVANLLIDFIQVTNKTLLVYGISTDEFAKNNCNTSFCEGMAYFYICNGCYFNLITNETILNFGNFSLASLVMIWHHKQFADLFPRRLSTIFHFDIEMNDIIFQQSTENVINIDIGSIVNWMLWLTTFQKFFDLFSCCFCWYQISFLEWMCSIISNSCYHYYINGDPRNHPTLCIKYQVTDSSHVIGLYLCSIPKWRCGCHKTTTQQQSDTSSTQHKRVSQ